MRVIAGSLKGRRLKSPDWEGLRPTSDKLRETLFNILAPRIAGARVVDVYAGTGALGIEALSRGALDVTFVEQDRRAQALIAENLAHCGVATGYTILRSDALRARRVARPGHGLRHHPARPAVHGGRCRRWRPSCRRRASAWPQAASRCSSAPAAARAGRGRPSRPLARRGVRRQRAHV